MERRLRGCRGRDVLLALRLQSPRSGGHVWEPISVGTRDHRRQQRARFRPIARAARQDRLRQLQLAARCPTIRAVAPALVGGLAQQPRGVRPRPGARGQQAPGPPRRAEDHGAGNREVAPRDRRQQRLESGGRGGVTGTRGGLGEQAEHHPVRAGFEQLGEAALEVPVEKRPCLGQPPELAVEVAGQAPRDRERRQVDARLFHQRLQLGEPALLAPHEIDRCQVDGRGLLPSQRLADAQRLLASALRLGEPAPEAGDLRVRKLAQPALYGLPQGLLQAVTRRQLGVGAGGVSVFQQARGAVHVGLDRLLGVPARGRGQCQLVDRAQALLRGPETSESDGGAGEGAQEADGLGALGDLHEGRARVERLTGAVLRLRQLQRQLAPDGAAIVDLGQRLAREEQQPDALVARTETRRATGRATRQLHRLRRPAHGQRGDVVAGDDLQVLVDCAVVVRAQGIAEAAVQVGARHSRQPLVETFTNQRVCKGIGSGRSGGEPPTDRYRGLVAATLGDWQQAARLLREAATADRAAGAPLCALRSDLDRARILLAAPDAPASVHGEAMALLREVERAAERAGFADILVEAQRRRGDAPLQETSEEATAPSSTSATRELRRSGDFWSLRWGPRTIQLADAKGVRYVAELLARPGQELSAMELATGGRGPGEAKPSVTAASGPVRVARDLGPAIDAAARAAYRRRAEELAATVVRAEAAGDLRRADRAREEQQALLRELAAATGLGGRARPTGDVSERARQSVTKAIKSALKRIRREHEELGRHLEATLHTGLFCRYEPDARLAVHWRVEV